MCGFDLFDLGELGPQFRVLQIKIQSSGEIRIPVFVQKTARCSIHFLYLRFKDQWTLFGSQVFLLKYFLINASGSGIYGILKADYAKMRGNMKRILILAMFNTMASTVIGPMDIFYQTGVVWNYF